MKEETEVRRAPHGLFCGSSNLLQDILAKCMRKYYIGIRTVQTQIAAIRARTLLILFLLLLVISITRVSSVQHQILAVLQRRGV